MSLLTLFLLLIITCGAFWLWKIAYAHVGAMPEAPPLVKWALQAITIVILIVAVCAIWGYGGGYITGGDIRIGR